MPVWCRWTQWRRSRLASEHRSGVVRFLLMSRLAERTSCSSETSPGYPKTLINSGGSSTNTGIRSSSAETTQTTPDDSDTRTVAHPVGSGGCAAARRNLLSGEDVPKDEPIAPLKERFARFGV